MEDYAGILHYATNTTNYFACWCGCTLLSFDKIRKRGRKSMKRAFVTLCHQLDPWLPPSGPKNDPKRPLGTQHIDFTSLMVIDNDGLPSSMEQSPQTGRGGGFRVGTIAAGNVTQVAKRAVGNFADHLQCNAVHGFVAPSGRGGEVLQGFQF